MLETVNPVKLPTVTGFKLAEEKLLLLFVFLVFACLESDSQNYSESEEVSSGHCGNMQ